MPKEISRGHQVHWNCSYSCELPCGCQEVPETKLGSSERATSALNCISLFFGIVSEQAMLTDIKKRSFYPSDPSVHPFLMGGTKPQVAPDAPGRADESGVIKKPEAEWQ